MSAMAGLYSDTNKRLCPLCGEEFYPGECRIMSRLTSGKELKPAPTGWLEKQRVRRNPESLLGPMYVKELASRECPHCGYLLPYNIESVESKSIVVVGDTYSGKSHYLAALINQIQEGQMQDSQHYMRFVCLTEDVLQYYVTEYLDKLFKNRKMIDATQPAIPTRPNKPLIYELIIKKSESHLPKRVNLILYDASGEDYASPERLVRYSRYVLNPSAIIFLADPYSMPNILGRLPPHLQNQPATARKAGAVLSSVLQLYERNLGVQSGSRMLRIPIGITLSKSDVLKYLRGINNPYRFLSNPRYGYAGGIDPEDLQVVDQEVRQLIEEFGDRALLQATQTLNTQFFAVSSTGFSPKVDGTYPAVEPRRCLDPVLWVLNKLRLIDEREG
jgi:Double-GTPase 2